MKEEKNNNKDEFQYSKKYKYSQNEKEYIINFGKIKNEDKIMLKIEEKSLFSIIYYEKIIGFEELKKRHHIFRYYDEIDEAVSDFFAIFEEKNFKFDFKSGNPKLELEINKGIKGKEKIYFELQIKYIDFHNTSKLYEEINSLKLKISELEKQQNKNEFKKINDEITALKEKNTKKDLIIEKLSKSLEEIEKWKKEIEDRENNEKNWRNKIDSKIITKKEELDFISDRIQNTEILKKKQIYYKLLFRATRDGTNNMHFHGKCDGIPNTISIIQTTKGYKFGGYIEKEWNITDGWVNDDEKSFIVSLDSMKIYNGVKGKAKHCCCDNVGPQFNCFDLGINMFSYSNFYGLNCYAGMNLNEINGGEEKFLPKEFEVFQIILK